MNANLMVFVATKNGLKPNVEQNVHGKRTLRRPYWEFFVRGMANRTPGAFFGVQWSAVETRHNFHQKYV